MKRYLLTTFATCVFALAWAQGQVLPDLERAQPAFEGQSPYLFYRLPNIQVDQETTVQFLYEVKGQAYAAELLTLARLDGGEAVELCSRNAALLTNLKDLAASGVSVRVTVENEHFRDSLVLGDMIANSDQITHSPAFRPVSLTAHSDMVFPIAEARLTAKGATRAATPCSTDCYNDYTACAQAICGFPTVFCDPCLSDYADCLANCCTPSSTTYSQTTLISTVLVGTSCLSNSYPSASTGTLYRTRRRNYKTETIQQTTDSYCNVSEQVIATSYFSDLCDYNTFIFCSGPVGKPACSY